MSSNKLDDLAGGGSQCAADAKFALAPRNLEREQTIQTHRSEHQPDDSERRDEDENESLGRARARCGILEREKVIRGEIRIRTGQSGTDRRLVYRAVIGVQNKGDVLERCRRVHEHLRQWPRDHAKHFAIAWIGDCFHIADDADNREPRASSIKPAPANAFPDRRIVRPKAFRDTLADNANERGVGSIARIEIAALQNRLADASEIPGHRHARVRSVDAAWLRCGRAFGVEQHQCP